MPDLETALDAHGELHAVVAEIDAEVELRRGTTTIGEEYITVEGPDTTHHFGRDRIVSWYRPMSVFHE